MKAVIQLFAGLWSQLRSMGLVFMNAFKKREVISYPEVKPYVPPRYRGRIVLTRDPAWTAEGVQVVHSAGELECLELMDPEIMVLGGAEIFSLMMPSMSRMWVSKVKGEYPADTFLPPFENRLERAVLKEHFEDFDLYLYEQVK